MKKEFLWNWTFYLVGLLILSLGVTLTIKGHRLGIGPWDVLHVGLYRNFGLSIGSWGIITGFIIITATAAVLRQWPKVGTWINMVLIGVFIDMFNWMIPDVHTFGLQVFMFILGVIVMAYGVGIYVSPNVGAGPRDGLMLILVEKTGYSIKIVRTGIEVTVAVIGWLLGGPVGIGTVIIALLTGQLVQYTIPQCRKLLHKVIGEQETKSKIGKEHLEPNA